MEIQHFKHNHPLLLINDDMTVHDEIPNTKCSICRRSIIAVPIYGCNKCKFYLHKSCAELPRQLHQSFHPSHPLTLDFSVSYWCDSCHKYSSDSPRYRCSTCDIDMDVECAMMPPITFTTEVDQKNIIQHFSHQHPMPLLHVDNKHEIECFGCRARLCSTDQVYGCTRCNYFLHMCRSCAVLKTEIQYPFHSVHGLLYLRMKHFKFKCRRCKCRYEKTVAYKCHRCHFVLCVNCSTTIRGTFKYEYHEHLLYLTLEMNTPISQCSIYESYCKQPAFFRCKEFESTSSCGFYCLECEFKVHLLCGPLPSTIKHQCHLHPLVLLDSLAEDYSGEFYCDVCETERDPQVRIYYCQLCKYVAHIHCVTSEITKVLTGDLRDVKLKDLGEDVWKYKEKGIAESSFTLKDIINALTNNERHRLKKKYKWHDQVKGRPKKHIDDKTAQSNLGYKSINQILQLSRFTESHFQQFYNVQLQHFWKNTKLKLKSSELGLKIVNVEGYMIPHTLAPVLKTLLKKVGDVSCDRKNYSQEWKSIVYYILCQVLKRMSSTKVRDITRNHLRKWYYHLKFVKRWNFDIDFAFDHLERVVRAFLGNQAKRLEDEIPTILKQKMDKFKRGLEKCEEYRGPSTKSEFMKDCLKEASETKWKNAIEGMFAFVEEDDEDEEEEEDDDDDDDDDDEDDDDDDEDDDEDDDDE